MKSKYSIDLFDEKDLKNSMSEFEEKNNKYITETAGFVPLEVKLAQFEQNGLRAQFQVQDFDSNDYRDMYLNPDFNITPEDDFEDVEEKLQMQREFIDKLKKSKASSDVVTEAAPQAVKQENDKPADTEE